MGRNYKLLIIYIVIIFLLIFITLIYVKMHLTKANINSKQKAQNILVYSKEFAERMGLDPNKAIKLDPGINAIGLTFKKDYSLDYYSSNFAENHHLFDLNPEEGSLFEQNLSILPILFKGEALPLSYYHECYLNIYFRNSDYRLKDSRKYALNSWDNQTDNKLIHDIATDFAKDLDSTIHKKNPTLYDYDKLFDFDIKIHNYINFYPAEVVLTKLYQPFINITLNGSLYLLENSQKLNLIDGITYLSFDLGLCYHMRKLANSNNAWLWLQKKNGHNYKISADNYYMKDFYVYKIPKELIDSPTLKEIIHHDELSD
jgi:hypothetical protein